LAFSVNATANASGGAGGTHALGGNAVATSDAIGTTLITSDATATGGAGTGTASATATGQGISGATVSATAIGQGSNGTADAKASTSLTGTLVTAVQSQALAPVAGASTAKTWAAIGATSAAFDSSGKQSIAQITGDPTADDVNAIFNGGANAGMYDIFHAGKTPTYFGIGELGGAYSTNNAGTETETSSIDMTVDLTKFSPLHDLLIGFYSGTVTGTGSIRTDPSFSMTLYVNVNGRDHTQTYPTIFAANTSLIGQVYDYGALSGSTLQLDVSLSITESAAAGAGGGYDFGMLIGDPPPASDAAAHHNMVAAISSLGAGDGDSSGNFKCDKYDDHRNVLAPHSA
jgi:hypothetical protein